MVRPHKPRRVGDPPRATMFKPAGIPAYDAECVVMSRDEYEAIRLVDDDGLDQDAAAEQMGVSRATVSRILARGRAKLAKMLTSSSALMIEGGAICPRERRGRGRQGWGRRHGRGRPGK